jgi:putative membrane protein
MKVRMIRMLLLATTVVLLSACGSMGTGMNGTPFGTTQPGMWPESDVAGIVMTANEGEVQQGNVASTRATAAEVRAFAQMMVSDHTTAMNNARDVFARNNVTPGENETTRTLRETSQRTVTNLSTYSGTAFDRTYMQSQVDLHQWLLNSLDTALIPSATRPEVRSLLTTQRASVATHLERARQILNGL